MLGLFKYLPPIITSLIEFLEKKLFNNDKFS